MTVIYLVNIEFIDWSIDNQIAYNIKEVNKLIKDFNKYGRVEQVNIYKIDTTEKTVEHEFRRLSK